VVVFKSPNVSIAGGGGGGVGAGGHDQLATVISLVSMSDLPATPGFFGRVLVHWRRKFNQFVTVRSRALVQIVQPDLGPLYK
jgi:hypothetical protein